MPALGPDDPVDHRPRRVLVAGTSGSGKTTLSLRIAALLGIEHIEIDALYHGPNWAPREQFESDVRAFSSLAHWITEWQYSSVRDLLADRADLLIWLDLPRRTVMRQVTIRTVRRRVRHQVLWNGNVEPPLHTIFADREHIVRWAWNTHHKSAIRVSELRNRRPDLTIVRLRSSAEVDRWVGGALTSVGPSPRGEASEQ